MPLTLANSEAVVREIEQRYAVTLPTDFRDYLVRVSPRDAFWEGDTIWWPATRVKNIPDECDDLITLSPLPTRASKYLFFADYMIWAWAWAICCDESVDRGKVVVINGRDNRVVAASFDEFVGAYVVDPLSLS